jgi:ribosome-associated protein
MAAEDLPVRRDLVIPQDELSVETSRASGPGGQNVNKVATRVSLRWSIARSRALDEARRDRLLDKLASRLTRDGELIVHVDETRSQARNRELARSRLAEIVRRALAVPRKRRPTKPTRASQQRRLVSKQRRSDVKRRRRPPRGDD